MEKIKSYTDLEQSKKLAEILPPESADMYYEPSPVFCTEPSEVRFGDIKYAHPRSIRCWSLAALLDILSKTAHSIDEDGSVDLCDYKNIEWSLCLTNTNVGLFTANNPVDACYQMIIKLHEIEMLCL